MKKSAEWIGNIAIYYLGDGPGDKNLPDENPVRPTKLYFNKKNQPEISFEIDYSGVPFFGLIRFNLDDFSSPYSDLVIYRLDVIKLDETEFIVLLNYVWTYPTDLENFEAIARFKGKVPEQLKPRLCPA